MKHPILAIALLLSVSTIGLAAAASSFDAPASSDIQSDKAPAQETRSTHATRLAEGFFDNLWGHARHGEHRSERGERESKSDDADDGGSAQDRTGASNLADPNSASASVPDNGVFTGKARPKVEVQ